MLEHLLNLTQNRTDATIQMIYKISKYEISQKLISDQFWF